MKYLILILLLFPLTSQAFSETVFVSEVNEVRSANGLQAVELDSTLSLIAYEKALDMCLSAYWAHNNNGNTWTFFERYGYSFKTAGEVIAKGYLTEEAMVNAWVNSPKHNAVLINPVYEKIGVATVGGITVQVFAEVWVDKPQGQRVSYESI